MTAPDDPAAGADVVLTLFGTTWAHAVARGLSFSEDRLADHLMRSAAVGRLLVANPYRSVVSRAVRVVRPRWEEPLPPPGTRVHHPQRLRRSDPADMSRTVRRYETSLRRAAARMGLERPAVITCNPLLAGFGDFSWAGPVTYYAWDDWTASVPHQRWWPAYRAAFARLRERGRRAVAVTEAALRQIDPAGPSAVVPNGIEPAEWDDLGQPPAWFAALPRPRLVYVGSLEGRVDVGQVRAVAEAYPGGSVTLMGPLLDPSHFESLRGLRNVELRAGLFPRREVVELIGGADACLVPHVRNALTEAMSPLKLYEYLAGGRPVAAVDLPPIAAVEGRVALAPAGGDLVPAVARALELGPAPEPERLAFVRAHAWSRRFDALLAVALG
jgi:teichuronic acid biosynthesis glycosyltransferase TuaH